MEEADLLGVQFLALDVAAFEHVLGQGLENSFLAEIEAESLHAADEAALLVP